MKERLCKVCKKEIESTKADYSKYCIKCAEKVKRGKIKWKK